MLERIESIDQLHKELKARGILSEIEALDVKNRTGKRGYRKRLESKYRSRKDKRPVCAYCGAYDGHLEVAHIEPVEIGGAMTENNLILLCGGCHNAFDKGAISIGKMKEIAKGWRHKRRPPLRELRSVPEMTKPPTGLGKFVCGIRRMEMEKHRQQAVRRIDETLSDSGLTRPQRAYLGILQAEMIRRGAGRGAIDQALRKLEGLSEVPAACKGYYCYERGYLLRLKGDHQEASAWMKRAASEARRRGERDGPGVDYVAASVNVILCEVVSLSTVTPKKAKGLLRRIGDLVCVARKNKGYWGGRWQFNCAVHALQVHIRAEDNRGSWRALKKMIESFEGVDSRTGWDGADRQTVTLLKGAVYARFHRNCAELADGVGLLARSFMSRVTDNRQRPEGIRDVGLELAKALICYGTGDAETIKSAKGLEAVMMKVVDGTSVLWPQ